ncbi:hypothetical protein DL93DRAFT_2081915 [Clavulina sp. PMI_390]|nr:hypothetical protein DL93DRAFT_2081915 [Clavulina sp. PMI_390]
MSRSAAVLVALFAGRSGDLYVMLNRSFPGDTSLPGGRWEPGDKSLEDTARREAFEEIGLPQDKVRIPFLCYLQPFLTGSNLLVTPVVVLILDPAIRPVLHEPEVSALFSHPFKSFLSTTSPFPDGKHHAPHLVDPRLPPARAPSYASSTAHLGSLIRQRHGAPGSETDAFRPLPPPLARESSVIPDLPNSPDPKKAAVVGWKKFRASSEPEPAPGEEEDANEMEYYSYRDIQWGQGPVRNHRFLTGREDYGIKPVYGLTATILLHAAIAGYDRAPDFVQFAPGEKSVQDRLIYALENTPVLKLAVEQEKKEREEKQRQPAKSRL